MSHDWLNNRLTEKPTGWLGGWMTDWPNNRLYGWLTDQLTGCLTSCLFDCQSEGALFPDWVDGWLSDSLQRCIACACVEMVGYKANCCFLKSSVNVDNRIVLSFRWSLLSIFFPFSSLMPSPEVSDLLGKPDPPEEEDFGLSAARSRVEARLTQRSLTIQNNDDKSGGFPLFIHSIVHQ